MKKIVYLAIALAVTAPLVTSCRDADLEPHLSTEKESKVENTEDLIAILNGAYNRMTQSQYYGRDFIVIGDARTDNAFSNGATNRFIEVAGMTLTSSNGDASGIWDRLYSIVASVNVILSKDASLISGNTATNDYYIGQAYAMRALAHFDLLQVFGQQNVDNGGMTALGVPYVTTFGNNYPKRNTVQEVYDNIQADLKKAADLMNGKTDPNGGSTHFITENAVKAFRARIALYFKQYADAEKYAKEVIDSGLYKLSNESNFMDTFTLDNQKNVIFAIANSANENLGFNSLAAIYGNIRTTYGDISFTKELYDLYEAGDIRKTLLVPSTKSSGSYALNKFKDDAHQGLNDIPVVRYEEIILIYAEAKLQQGNAAEALTYLNMIPSNRGASPYTVANLDNILLERRKEFAGEGQRFSDIMRVGRELNNILAKDPIVPYGDSRLALPIPLSEMRANGNMVQNKGYDK